MMEFCINSIIVVAGPTGSGKSWFIKEKLFPKLCEFIDSSLIKVISSDDNRKFIIGNEVEKYSNDFSFSSKGAYELLKTQINVLTSYPQNRYTKILIVDTTGLSNEFHKIISEIREKNKYSSFAIVFNYKKTEDFFLHSKNKQKTEQQLRTFRTTIFKSLYDYKQVYTIKDKKFSDEISVKISYEDLAVKLNECVVVGSIHGDHNALEKVCEQYKGKKKMVIMGNYMGTDPSMIDTMWSLLLEGNIIMRGHIERSIYDLIEKKNSENIDERIIKLVDKMTDEQKFNFYRLFNSSKIYVNCGKYDITATCCERRYLGKSDKTSEFQQTKLLNELPNDNNVYDLIHVFSNPEVSKCVNNKSMIMMGTGCGNGGFLTIMEIGKNGNKIIKNIKSFLMSSVMDIIIHKTEDKTVEIKEVDFTQISPQVMTRIKKMAENSINYISGTICPADKDTTTFQLESPKKALEYYTKIYKESEFPLLSVQIKDMGSRFQYYYFTKDKERSFGVTRNGFKCATLSQDVLNSIYDSLTLKLQKLENFDSISLVIVDGELMPWSALGKTLIDNEFTHVYNSVRSELSLLDEFGFEEQEQKLLDQFNLSDYKSDFNKLSGKDLSDKYGGSVYQTYKVINENQKHYTPIAETEKRIKIFGEQLDIFGKDGEIHYNPFSILKICYSDHEVICGDEKMGNVEMYELLSDHESLVLDTNNDFNDNLLLFQKFWDDVIVPNKYEGVVIKPDFVNMKYAPAIKVRNSSYLHIIYGYDYLSQEKFSKLLKNKNIRDKLNASIREFQIGINMLQINFNDITESDQMKTIYCNFIEEELKEKTYDMAL